MYKKETAGFLLDRGSGLPAPIQESSRFSPRAFLLSCWCDEIVQIPVRKRKAKTLCLCLFFYFYILLVLGFTMQNYSFFFKRKKKCEWTKKGLFDGDGADKD